MAGTSLFPKLVLFLFLPLFLPGGAQDAGPCASLCSCSWRRGLREMVCPGVSFLPGLPVSRGSGRVVRAMVLTRGSKVDRIGYNQLYSLHLDNLQRIDMVSCQLRYIDPQGFYSMVQLQHLNIRCGIGYDMNKVAN